MPMIHGLLSQWAPPGERARQSSYILGGKKILYFIYSCVIINIVICIFIFMYGMLVTTYANNLRIISKITTKITQFCIVQNKAYYSHAAFL